MGIEIKNLKKSFGEKEVLKGINFEFETGKINMIIGASGSGKSVMLKCIVGLMRPTSGQVIYDGLDFHAANHKEVRNFRTNMGMLFQYSALFDYMTVEENIAFPIQLFTKSTKKAIKRRVEFCLERVNMSGTNHLYPAELSGGMMKRVGIARAIALNPKYLFVDEPNSGLDPLTASVIDELIKEITYEFNMTTVVVSHDMNSVVNISDKILFLFNGQKEWQGTKLSILRSGNPNLDKFVFVSDLIRRDIYDVKEAEAKAAGEIVDSANENVVEAEVREAAFDAGAAGDVEPGKGPETKSEKGPDLEKKPLIGVPERHDLPEAEVPEVPEVVETPEVSAKVQAPATPEVVETQEVPEVPSAEVEVTPEVPSVPAIPEVPLAEETPADTGSEKETVAEASTPPIPPAIPPVSVPETPSAKEEPSSEKPADTPATTDAPASDKPEDTPPAPEAPKAKKPSDKTKLKKKSAKTQKRRVHPKDAGKIRRRDNKRPGK